MIGQNTLDTFGMEQESKMASTEKSSEMEGASWNTWWEALSLNERTDGDEDVKPLIEKQSDSMKLQRKDINVFGYAPFAQQFALAQCETCHKFIKLSAFKEHHEKHDGSESLDNAVSSLTKLNGQASTKGSWKNSVAGKKTSHSKKHSQQGSKVKSKASLKQKVRPCTVPYPSGSIPRANGDSSKGEISSHKPKQPNTIPVVKVERILPGKDVSFKISASRVSQEEAGLGSGVPAVPCIRSERKESPFTLSEKMHDDSWTRGSDQTVASSGTGQYCTVVSPAKSVTTVAISAPYSSTLTTQATSSRLSAVRAPSYHSALKSSQELASMLTKNSTFPPALAPSLFPAGHGVTSASNSSIVSSSSFVVSGGTVVSSATHASSDKKKKNKERKFLPCKDREFDPDKHCGVLVEGTGKPCTRSLTCKTHSLRLQREVLGRSKTLDELLAERKVAKEAELRARVQEQQSSITVTPNQESPLAAEFHQNSSLKMKLAHSASLPSLALMTLKGVEDARTVKMETSSPQHLDSAVFRKVAPGSSLPTGLYIHDRSPPRSRPMPESWRTSQDAGVPFSKKSVVPSVKKEAGVPMQGKPYKHPGKVENVLESTDLPSLAHQPRPAAINPFCARLVGRGTILNSRRQDCLRAACFKSFQVDKDPSPPKKICLAPSSTLQSLASSGAIIATPVSGLDGGLASQRPTVSFTIGNPSCAALKGRPFLKPGLKPPQFVKVPAVVMGSGASSTPTNVMLSIPTSRTITATSIVGVAPITATATSVLNVPSNMLGTTTCSVAVSGTVALTDVSVCLPGNVSSASLAGMSASASSSEVLSLPVNISGGTASSVTAIDMTGLNLPLSGNITFTGGSQDSVSSLEGGDLGVPSTMPTILGVSGSPSTFYVSSLPAGISTSAGASGTASIVGIASTNIGKRLSATSASKSLASSSSKTLPGVTFPNPSLAAALLEAPSTPSKMAAGSSSTGSQPAAASLPSALGTRLLKRKHSDISQGESSSGHIVPSAVQFPSNGSQWKLKAGPSGLGLIGANGIRLAQSQSATLLMPVSTVGAQSTTTSLSAVTFTNPTAVGLGSTLPAFKQPVQKLSKIKGVNLVLSRGDTPVQCDGARFNGQYLNVTATGTQLAHLAAVQAVSATAEDKNIKRNQLAKHGQNQISGKVQTLRGTNMLRAIPAGAVLVDGNMQGTVLTPVSLSGGGTPTLLVAQTTSITTLSRQSASSTIVRPHSVARTVSSSTMPHQATQVTGSITNGIPSAGESLQLVAGTSQRQHQKAPSLQAIPSKLLRQTGSSPAAAKALQVTGLAQPQATPICPAPNASQITHFSIQGGRLQSIPVMNSMGPVPTASQPPSHTIPPPSTALLVTSAEEGQSAGGAASGGGLGAEFPLQPPISNASSRVMS